MIFFSLKTVLEKKKKKENLKKQGRSASQPFRPFSFLCSFVCNLDLRTADIVSWQAFKIDPESDKKKSNKKDVKA